MARTSQDEQAHPNLYDYQKLDVLSAKTHNMNESVTRRIEDHAVKRNVLFFVADG